MFINYNSIYKHFLFATLNKYSKIKQNILNKKYYNYLKNEFNCITNFNNWAYIYIVRI